VACLEIFGFGFCVLTHAFAGTLWFEEHVVDELEDLKGLIILF
jgi:hypothetical protein